MIETYPVSTTAVLEGDLDQLELPPLQKQALATLVAEQQTANNNFFPVFSKDRRLTTGGWVYLHDKFKPEHFVARVSSSGNVEKF